MSDQNEIVKKSAPLPWYKDGLRFKCTDCGKCCTGTPGFIWVTMQEISAMADFLKISQELFKRRYIRSRDNRFALIEKKTENGDHACIFLKDKKCQVYKARPTQCRTFPWWKENLNTEESWKLAAEQCEGINMNAPLIPYSEISQSL
jgi:Fe-S-cluster containining protein